MHSSKSPEARRIRGLSPCPACNANRRSPCSWRVGMPVLGPARWYSVITTGTSLIEAQPIPSIMRENPGPDVAVAERVPVSAAPVAIVIAAISSSVWTTRIEAPSSFGVEAGAVEVEHLVLLEELALIGRRGDRVVRLESHSSVQLAKARRLASGEEELGLLPRELLETVRELRHEGLGDVVRLPSAGRVHVHDLRLRAEHVLEGASHHFEIEAEDPERRPDR